MKISLYIVVFIVRGCFTESTMSLAGFEYIISALDERALLLHDYDKLSRIFFMFIIDT